MYVQQDKIVITVKDLRHLSVLVVDDNQHMLALMRGILSALGIKNVRTVRDGVLAFEELRVFAADLVICDCHMEPLDGIDFVRLIRTASDSPNKTVPIMMMTGHSDRATVLASREAGVTEFLAKPISVKALAERILRVIQRQRQEDATKP